MKSLRYFLILLILGLSSSAVLADPVDPKMGLQGGCCSTGLFTPSDPNFTFTVQGGNFTTIGETIAYSFINATNQLALGVNLSVTLLPGTPALTFTCLPFNQYFTDCSPQTPGMTLSDGGTLVISFFSPNTGEGGFGGIPFGTDVTCDGVHSCTTSTPGADFAVAVTDVGGDLVNLGNGQGFKVQGTLLVAEPSTVLLVLAGGILFLFFKRR